MALLGGESGRMRDNGTETMAERALHLDGQPTVRIALGAPQPLGPSEFTCPFEIVGLGREHSGQVHGIDKVPAVQLAMQTVGTLLYLSDEFLAGRLSWRDEAGDTNDLGFPRLEGLSSAADP